MQLSICKIFSSPSFATFILNPVRIPWKEDNAFPELKRKTLGCKGIILFFSKVKQRYIDLIASIIQLSTRFNSNSPKAHFKTSVQWRICNLFPLSQVRMHIKFPFLDVIVERLFFFFSIPTTFLWERKYVIEWSWNSGSCQFYIFTSIKKAKAPAWRGGGKVDENPRFISIVFIRHCIFLLVVKVEMQAFFSPSSSFLRSEILFPRHVLRFSTCIGFVKKKKK